MKVKLNVSPVLTYLVLSALLMLTPSLFCVNLCVRGDVSILPPLSAWAPTPPTIDGVIDIDEWSPACAASYTTTGGVNGTLYVMNDAESLYIAVVTEDATLSVDGAGTDSVKIYFDNDHSGTGPEVGDDIIGWTGYLGEGFKDGFSDGSYVWRRDTDYGGVSDGAAMATSNGSHNHFELLHPLNSDDDAHDFSLSMHQALQNEAGLGIRLTVDGVDRGWWPSSDPASWRDLTVFRATFSAWAETTPMIDGILNPAQSLLIDGEWDDAARMDFLLTWDAVSYNVSLYVKNDYVNLYLALEIHDEDYNGSDKIVFNFDNDNDGWKASHDNRVFVEGWHKPVTGGQGFYQDAYFPYGVGSSEWDVNGGGVNDGVGAAGFWGSESTSSYVYEVAYPLNTSDDSYDFSLHVDDTIGFNVMYMDAGGPTGDGWPTFTEEEWSQMAEIEIAAHDFPPGPARGVNLRIDQIEITQGTQWLDDALPIPPWNGEPNSVTLVRGKSTIVRVYVDVGTGARPIQDVAVYLYAVDGINGLSLAQPGKYFPNGPLQMLVNVPVTPDRGNENHTANFRLPTSWVERVSITLMAFVKALPHRGETDYADNWMSRQTFSFTETQALEIGYYRIDYRPTAPDENPNLPSDEKLLNGKTFFERVTPMPDLSSPVTFYELGPPIVWEMNFTKPSDKPRGWDDNVTAFSELLTNLTLRHQELMAAGDAPDLVMGLYANAITDTGWARINGRVFIAHEVRWWSFAHEIGHNFGLNHSWQDLHPWAGDEGKNSSQTYGYDTHENWLPRQLEHTVKIPAANDTEMNVNYGALMSYYGRRRWISPWEWEHLVEAFDPLALAEGHFSASSAVRSSTPGLQITGIIRRNNTGSLRPIFQTPTFLNITPPSGPYTIELRGPPPEESLLHSLNFNVTFEPDASYATFLLNLPFSTEAYSLSLLNSSITSVLLDTITASANPPQVTITSPNGGENVGDSLTATWTAADVDGDPLTFNLFASSDNGTNWSPLATRLKETSLQADISMLSGGFQWLLWVQASDGFHTSEDYSDAVFNVSLKSPRHVVGIGVGPCMTYNFGEPVTFKGAAFDPEDGVLQDPALTWASDLEGLLGTGRVLTTTELRPGAHNITLTATDSHGNNVTTSFEVTIHFHNMQVSSISNIKPIVGLGYPIPINVTATNTGYTAQTFDVLLYDQREQNYSEGWNLSDTMTCTLPNGSSTDITFMLNTTLWEKGNYTFCAYIIPVAWETLIHDNWLVDGWAFVTLPGDVDADRDVDIFDIVMIASAYGSEEGDPDYNPLYDLDGDGDIDIFDIVAAAGHYGESW